MEDHEGTVTEKGDRDPARRGYGQAGEALQRAGTETRRTGEPHRVTRSPSLRVIFKGRGDLTTPRRTNKMSYL